MEAISDPSLITAKITVVGQDGLPDIMRKFKLSIDRLERDVIHETVSSQTTSALKVIDAGHGWL
jgi:hypothetical protein